MSLQRPTILLFVPFADRFSLAGEPAWDDDDGAVGSHTATIQIRNAANTLVYDDTLGEQGTGYYITGQTFTPGERLRARMRYHAGGDDSPWSTWYFSRVPLADPSFSALAVTGPPPDGGSLPVTPDFQQSIRHARPVHEFTVEANYPLRRPRFTGQYRDAQIVWLHKTKAERDALVNFLHARIRAAEAFRSTDPILGDRLWWPRAGSIQEIQIHPGSPGVWTISVDAEEVPS